MFDVPEIVTRAAGIATGSDGATGGACAPVHRSPPRP
jgi:hypothetical protein